MIILICGSRHWQDKDFIGQTLRELIVSEKPWLGIVHGDCPTGADHHCREFCELYGICEFRCPANWKKYGKVAGPVRNEWMTRLQPAYVLAFHENFETSKGTKDMVNRAIKLEIECNLYDGRKWTKPK